jgi:N-acyl-L-homoserine lactone synthetase
MSNIDRSVTNAEVIPLVENSDLFADNPEARFAVGIIAVGDEIVEGREAEFDGYLKLRAGVYAKQTRMIGMDQVREDGTEMDADDSRSVHFAVFEQHALGARAVGSMRLIIKGEDGAALPIEEFFPAAFKPTEQVEVAHPAAPHQPAEEGDHEASRLIARNESAAAQRVIKWKLFAGAAAYIINHELGKTYATVETTVESDFNACKMPNERIAEPEYVEEYLADNLGVVIDVPAFGDVIDTAEPGIMNQFSANEGQMIYFGRQPAAKMPAPEYPIDKVVALAA